ncbi:hypothetical protein [Deinococcus pimensis]|uniref:hypothetical protein n=1 Tax=Deinococcus pimensis TaxID=309888 RepID=UPI0004AF7EB0|nr:hypothetical protein [Deinococcus pimensis]
MKRVLLPTLVLLGVASAANFAGFAIKPYGDQKVNLATGVTTLPKGGVATDAKQGVTVDAKFIEFKEGDYLAATTAKLVTKDGGTLTGDKLDYRVRSGNLTATGNLKYDDENVKGLTAQSMTIDATKKIGVAVGGVRSATPAMNADRVVVDYENNRAVMYGNYRYSFGGTRLASAKPDATLLVTWNGQGRPSVTSRPTAQQLAPYQAYLK